jgi:hypothetical protein
MSTYRLPVSGLQVMIQQPTGREDLLLQETTHLDFSLVFTLFDRLVRLPQDATHDWGELAITDVETLLLLLRREVLGNLIRAETDCTATGCKTRVDVSFGIKEYLASLQPRVPGAISKIEGEWPYRLDEGDVRFRLPNGHDWAAHQSQAASERLLIQSCIRPPGAPAHLRRRIERAMHALGPRLTRTMSGECPECKASVSFHFDVMQFVLREVRDHAASIFEDVHLLAVYYKWPEEDILALPRSRRLRYGNALREQRSAA